MTSSWIWSGGFRGLSTPMLATTLMRCVCGEGGGRGGIGEGGWVGEWVGERHEMTSLLCVHMNYHSRRLLMNFHLSCRVLCIPTALCGPLLT